jgi:hypothetical protein
MHARPAQPQPDPTAEYPRTPVDPRRAEVGDHRTGPVGRDGHLSSAAAWPIRKHFKDDLVMEGASEWGEPTGGCLPQNQLSANECDVM